MTADALRDKLEEQPFRPFALRMPDGRKVPVPHPDFISIAPNRQIAIVWKPQSDGGYWSIDLRLVSDIHSLNGPKKGRR